VLLAILRPNSSGKSSDLLVYYSLPPQMPGEIKTGLLKEFKFQVGILIKDLSFFWNALGITSLKHLKPSLFHL